MSNQNCTLTHKELLSILIYNPSTGIFTRRVRSAHRVAIGDVAGTILNTGYIHIGIMGKRYLAHRLAWLYVRGDWPVNEIDHIDGIRHNNRIDNLRDVSRTTNSHNQRKAKSNSKSGYRGVYFGEEAGLWCAQISTNRKTTHLGYFKNINDAITARKNAEIIYHPTKPQS